MAPFWSYKNLSKTLSCLFSLTLDRKYYKVNNKGVGRLFQNGLSKSAPCKDLISYHSHESERTLKGAECE